MPGDGTQRTDQILGHAAEAHRRLLSCAAAEATTARRPAGWLPAAIASLLDHFTSVAANARSAASSGRAFARRFLVDPAFVEGLHRATLLSPTLADWHRRVAEPSIANIAPPADAESAHRLGNSLLPLLLRVDPHWRGEVALRTDVYGRLRFPLCDWSIALSRTAAGPGCVLSDDLVTASLTRREVRLALGDTHGGTLLVMPRDEWLRMIVANDAQLDGNRIRLQTADVTARLQHAGPLPGRRVRYEPVRLANGNDHFALTGGIIAALLGALGRHSLAIAREFDTLMSTVRGWELPAAAYGTIQSFSDPTLPRVMALNVPYGRGDEPRLCPFCFTWLGHELGHTKSYLIETILHVRGEALTTNQADYTEVIPRYGRALPLRTVLQVPYTHLYEWTLLMDLAEGAFAGLPWEITDDAREFGENIHQEIVEAFDQIERAARLTPCGREAVARLHSLCSEAQVRWQSLSRGVPRSPPSCDRDRGPCSSEFNSGKLKN
jgi:hypothetical protein